MTSEALRAAIEEAELSAEQTQDLFSYLEEHGIEILDGRARPRLQLRVAAGGRDGDAAGR